MTPAHERYRRLRDVFDRALPLDAAARGQHVDEALGDDPQLRSRCLQLLTALESARSFLEMPIGRWPPDLGDVPFTGSDRFEVVRRVGAGGMGIVYEVRDHLRQEVVALKTLRDTNAGDRYRLKREFRGLADVSHPNLASLYELFVEDERCFFTMELVAGSTFVEHVRGAARVQLSLDRLVPALGQLVHGVEALHRRGILHRDIKPSNVLVTATGRVVILDFGLISEQWQHAAPASRDSSGGTPAYMAPEAIEGGTSQASDWYSVGATLYEALTGSVPFGGPLPDLLRRKRTEDPPPPRQLATDPIPEYLNDICVQLLSRDPDARVAGVRALGRLGSSAEPPTPCSTAVSCARFIGREPHLHALDEALESTARGAAPTVSIHGASGMGKTALVAEFIRRCRERGPVVVLSGRCYENESVPHKALDGVVDELSRYLLSLPEADVVDLLPTDRAALARVFPVMHQVPRMASRDPGDTSIAVDPLRTRSRAFDALSDLLVRIATRQRLVVWVDDFQWSDADSARVLEAMLASSTRPPMLTLLTFRSEELPRKPFLRAFVERAGRDGWTTLPLEPLAHGEALALVGGLASAQSPLSADEQRQVLREAGGNPFVLEQLALYAADTKRMAADAPFLAGLLESRLDRLPPMARAFVEVLAVCGRPVAPDVVCDACHVDRDRQSLVVALRAAHLIRSSGSLDRVEPYHDQIREALAGRLGPETVREIHARMAETLESRGGDDSEALFVHYRGAEDLTRASVHAERAAEKATEALAFDRAAALYSAALDLAPHAASAHAWQRGLAAALANAGRPAEAAEAYLRLAAIGAPAERIESQRRAGEQFLIGGHIDRGLSLMGTSLQSVGLSVAGSPGAALRRVVWRRARQWWRGLDFVECPAGREDPDAQLRLDTCWAAATGLALVDVVGASDFGAWHLHMALDAGDVTRVARGLALESAARNADWTYRRSSARLAQLGKVLSQRIGTPHAMAMALLGDGLCAVAVGEWKRLLVLAEDAITILRDRCVGVSWELTIAQNMAIWALMYLGELGEVSRRVPALLTDARRRGDLYLATELCTRSNYAWLAADNPDEGERETLAAIAQWSQRGFHRQHYSAMLARVQTALYRGDADAAWRLVVEHESPLRASKLTYVQTLRIESHYLRGRSALALAAARGRDDGALAEARRCARRIAREKMPWSNPLASLLDAGIACVEGQTGESMRLLDESARQADRADMQLYAAVARRRLGELRGGEEGPLLQRQTEAWMASQRIQNSAAITRMLAPGFPAR